VVLRGVPKKRELIFSFMSLEILELFEGREETINRNNLCGIMSVKLTVEVTNDIIEM
jgi:hypothetical protein